MIFLQGPRENWGYKILRRKAKKVSRAKTYNNLESAQTVGILYDATSKTDTEDVMNFASELGETGKNVETLGILPTKIALAAAGGAKAGHALFAADECSFFFLPKGPGVEKFVAQKFDILFNVCTTSSIVSDYIVAMSQAKFKVSSVAGDNDYADFILLFGPGAGAEGTPRPKKSAALFISSIKQYLSNIAKA